MGKYKQPRGQPRAFRSGAHLFESIQAFCDDIIEQGYTVLPSKTEFCRWYSNQTGRKISRRTVWSTMEKYYPDVKGKVNVLVSDVLAQGAALGYWNSTVTIFVLKNWCHWSDKLSDSSAPSGGEGKSAVTFTFEVIDKVEAKQDEA